MMLKLTAAAVKLKGLVVDEAEIYYQEQKRKVYFTEASYLDFFKTYHVLIEKKLENV